MKEIFATLIILVGLVGFAYVYFHLLRIEAEHRIQRNVDWSIIKKFIDLSERFCDKRNEFLELREKYFIDEKLDYIHNEWDLIFEKIKDDKSRSVNGEEGLRIYESFIKNLEEYLAKPDKYFKKKDTSTLIIENKV